MYRNKRKLLKINTDKHLYDLDILNQIKLTVNTQTLFSVLFFHIGSTVTQFTILSGLACLGVLEEHHSHLSDPPSFY